MSDPNARVTHPVRICFSRAGAPIWLAHLDMMRTLERSLLRAGLPIAYSQGFNPRPELVFALPAGVGIETVNDYADVFLTDPVPAETVQTALSGTLPPGIRIHSAWELPGGQRSIMGQVREAAYRVCFSGADTFAPRLMAADQLPVEKWSKGRRRPVDIRPLLLSADGSVPDVLAVRVRAGSAENLRMDSLCAVLMEQFGAPAADVNGCRLIRDELFLAAANGGVCTPAESRNQQCLELVLEKES